MSQIPNGQLNVPSRGNRPLDGRLRTTVADVGLSVPGVPTDNAAPGASRAQRLAAALGGAAKTTGDIAKTIETQMQGKATVDARNEVSALRDAIANRELTLREGESVDAGVERLLKERLVNDDRTFGKAYKKRFRDIMGPELRASFVDQHREVETEARVELQQGWSDAISGAEAEADVAAVVEDMRGHEWVTQTMIDSVLLGAAGSSALVGRGDQVAMYGRMAGGRNQNEYLRMEQVAASRTREIKNSAEREAYDSAENGLLAMLQNGAFEESQGYMEAQRKNLSPARMEQLESARSKFMSKKVAEDFKDASKAAATLVQEIGGNVNLYDAEGGQKRFDEMLDGFGILDPHVRAAVQNNAVLTEASIAARRGELGGVEAWGKMIDPLDRGGVERLEALRGVNSGVLVAEAKRIVRQTSFDGLVSGIVGSGAEGHLTVQQATAKANLEAGTTATINGVEVVRGKPDVAAAMAQARANFIPAAMAADPTLDEFTAGVQFDSSRGYTDPTLAAKYATVGTNLHAAPTPDAIGAFTEWYGIAVADPATGNRYAGSGPAEDVLDYAYTLANTMHMPLEVALRESMKTISGMQVKGLSLEEFSKANAPGGKVMANAIGAVLGYESTPDNEAVFTTVYQYMRSVGSGMDAEQAEKAATDYIKSKYTNVDGTMLWSKSPGMDVIERPDVYQAIRAAWASASGEDIDSARVHIEPRDGSVSLRMPGGIMASGSTRLTGGDVDELRTWLAAHDENVRLGKLHERESSYYIDLFASGGVEDPVLVRPVPGAKLIQRAMPTLSKPALRAIANAIVNPELYDQTDTRAEQAERAGITQSKLLRGGG